MEEKIENVIKEFWAWFATNAELYKSNFDIAAAQKNYGPLNQIVQEIHNHLSVISPNLDLNLNGGKGKILLTIRSSSPELVPLIETILRLAPNLPSWDFSNAPASSPPQNIIVRNEDGNELIVPYNDIMFVISLEKTGKCAVTFLLKNAFDPKGPDADLYKAAAEEVFKFNFGSVPPNVSSFQILPFANGDFKDPRPISEFREALLNAKFS